ncbi:S8 family serine peptidase, partial [Candidatus Desantisbacteria bacterium]|nr:S8 family serine peptidase [Candidatus Desantisbacteria bacterium]
MKFLYRILLICIIFNIQLNAEVIKSGTPAGKKKDISSYQNKFKDDEILVKFKASSSKSSRNKINKRINASVKNTFKKTQVSLIKIPSSMKIHEALKYYKNNQNVEYAEPNYIVQINSIFPDDPRFDELWGLHNTGQSGGVNDADIDAPEAWEQFKGDSTLIVAVIDTGIDYTHEDLKGNLWINESETEDGIDNDGNGYIDDIHGINAITDSGDPMDDYGHGTHVSGTIGAVGGNGIGVTGVNWNVKLMGLKWLGREGSGSISDAIKCIEYILDMKEKGVNIKISNNSWGLYSYSLSLYDAVKSLRDKGVIFVAAAGNSSLDNDEIPSYPCSYNLDNIISVAATDSNDTRASFSNVGPTCVDIGAPGVGIAST